MYIKNCNLKEMSDEMKLLYSDDGEGGTVPSRENKKSIEGRELKGNLEGKEKTLDELLMDKKYQSEFDKKVAKALKTAKAKWENENSHPTIENHKPIKMDYDQKVEFLKEKKLEALRKKKKDIATRELKDIFNQRLLEKVLSRDLLDKLNYSSIKQYNKSIELMEDTLKSAAERAMIKGRDKELLGRENSLIIITDIDVPIRDYKGKNLMIRIF